MHVSNLHLAAVATELPGRQSAPEAVRTGLITQAEATRTGIESVSVAPDRAPADLAAAAATSALARAGIPPHTVRLLLYANVWYQGHDLWAPASYVQRTALGSDCPAIEIRQLSNGGMAMLELAAHVLSNRGAARPITAHFPPVGALPGTPPSPAIRGVPAAEPLLTAGAGAGATAESLPTGVLPATEPLPTAESVPTSELLPTAEPLLATEPLLTTESLPTAESVPTTESLRTAESVPTTESLPTSELVPTAEPLPAEPLLANGVWSTTEPLPAAEALPANGVLPATEVSPTAEPRPATEASPNSPVAPPVNVALPNAGPPSACPRTAAVSPAALPAAALLTTGDVFHAPGFQRWRSDPGTVYGDGGTAAILSTEGGFAALLSIATVSDPELEGMHRGADPFGPEQFSTRKPLDLHRQQRDFLTDRPTRAVVARVAAGQQEATERALKDAGLTMADIDLFVLPHFGRRRLSSAYLTPWAISDSCTTWPWARTVGHLGAGDQFAGLEHLVLSGRLRPGQHCLLAGVGAGFSWSAAVLRVERASWGLC